MFISVRHLETEMGVDPTIGRFFVDRKPPENNSFWKGRLLYIAFGNGYVSIPVYYDILRRIGVPTKVLLDEKHILFMEQLMHFAIQHERKEISQTEQFSAIRSTLKDRVQNQSYFKLLNNYLDQEVLKPVSPFGLSYPSLNRADAFLYILTDLPLSEIQWKQALRYWYALHPAYLLMDDIRDYSGDLENGEENVVIDLGSGSQGFEKAFSMLRDFSETIREINPLLAGFLENYDENLRIYIPVNI